MNKMKKAGIASLAVQIILFKFLASRPDWIENYYVPYVFRPLSFILRSFTSFFPFSVGLILVYLAVFLLIFFLVKNYRLVFLRKKHFWAYTSTLIAWLSPIYLYFMLTWGFLYHRQPVSELMGFSSPENINVKELRDLCEHLVNETNATRALLDSKTIENLSRTDVLNKAPQAFQNLEKELPFLKYQTPSIKAATGSKFIAYMGAGGIYTFWSGEANINKIHPTIAIPGVTLHEMAHQAGIASEDEANFIAYYTGKSHPDPLFRYSANYEVVFRSLNKLWWADSTAANSLFSQLDSVVLQDRQLDYESWAPYRNLVQQYVVSPFYSFFLKSNGVQEGIMSYDRVVDLIILERRRLLSFPENTSSSKLF